jgi:oligopeptidase A
MNNPLLSQNALPSFSAIKTEHIEPAIDNLLEDSRTTLEALLKDNESYSWDNLIRPLEEKSDALSRAWSPVSHLHSVADNEALREAYNTCLPKLIEFGTEMGQHEGLYQAYLQLQASEAFPNLHIAQKKSIGNALREFRLSGIGLNEDERERYKNIKQEISALQTKFEENILDATQDWEKHIEEEAQLAGLPTSAMALAAQNAKAKDKTGWLINLEFPSYLPVMQYADDRFLREELYQAFVTRASEQGPSAGKWDNGEIMVETLALRQQQAELIGFDNYADYSLSRKMAADASEVLGFLNDLASRSKAVALADVNELCEFAKTEHQVSDLQAWDMAYYSEKLRVHKYDISQEQLRPYFPAPQVILGMFAVVNRLYGITIKQVAGVEVWHDDVSYFEIHDSSARLRGSFYLDIYARPQKRGGAWMDECVVRRDTGSELQTAVAYLNCNFTPPIADDPSLLTHDEVTTLFHEFGHGLHHMLSLIDFPEVSGINGVAWDAVELPSQFMENWCWERESLNLIASHYQSGEALPNHMYEKMLKAKSFQSGMQMCRQLEFALFDFRMHHEKRGDSVADIQVLLDDVRSQVAVIAAPDYNRFQHGFSHIFAGGYAAGYYSYKWAEVLSADAFSMFEENGIFDKSTGELFLNSILEQGGSREPMDLFVEFRGRKPSIEPLLRHSGIMTKKTISTL